MAPPLVKAAPDAIMPGDVITRALLKGDLDNSDYGWAKDRGFGEAAGAPPSIRTSMKHGLVGLVLI